MDGGENTDRRYAVQATHPQTGDAIDERSASLVHAVDRAAELIRAGFVGVQITSTAGPT